jgi:hypothetical protein
MRTAKFLRINNKLIYKKTLTDYNAPQKQRTAFINILKIKYAI